MAGAHICPGAGDLGSQVKPEDRTEHSWQGWGFISLGGGRDETLASLPLGQAGVPGTDGVHALVGYILPIYHAPFREARRPHGNYFLCSQDQPITFYGSPWADKAQQPKPSILGPVQREVQSLRVCQKIASRSLNNL